MIRIGRVSSPIATAAWGTELVRRGPSLMGMTQLPINDIVDGEHAELPKDLWENISN